MEAFLKSIFTGNFWSAWVAHDDPWVSSGGIILHEEIGQLDLSFLRGPIQFSHEGFEWKPHEESVSTRKLSDFSSWGHEEFTRTSWVCSWGVWKKSLIISSWRSRPISLRKLTLHEETRECWWVNSRRSEIPNENSQWAFCPHQNLSFIPGETLMSTFSVSREFSGGTNWTEDEESSSQVHVRLESQEKRETIHIGISL